MRLINAIFLSQILFVFIIKNPLIYASPTIIYVDWADGGRFGNCSMPGQCNLFAALQSIGDDSIIDCSMIAGQSINLIVAQSPGIGHTTTPNPTLAIRGYGVTIDGGGSVAGFSLGQGSVTISDLTIQNTLSQGGPGGEGLTGGGGGAGGGGALYIHAGTVMTISAVALSGNHAGGGDGGAGSTTSPLYGAGGGGGGYGGGPGGAATRTTGGCTAPGGGGGGGGNNGGEDGGNQGGVGSGSTIGSYGGGGGGGAFVVAMGAGVGAAGGVVAAAATSPAKNGGLGSGGGGSPGSGGGGAGSSPTAPNIFPYNPQEGFGLPQNDNPVTPGMGGVGGYGFGVNGTYGAGGGGGGVDGGAPGYGASGGGGGFNGPGGGSGGPLGGGGGASGNTAHLMGGNGGFGGGGGAGYTGGIDPFGLGGSGGSETTMGMSAHGGGGAGLGGAILIQEGALLIIQDECSFSGNGVAGGSGSSVGGGAPGGDGTSLGRDIFIQSGGGLTFQIDGTLSIPNPIEGAFYLSNISPAVIKSGIGTVFLNESNTYLGGTSIQEGTFNLNGSVLGDLTIESVGTLSGNATVNGNIYSSGTISPGNSIGTVNAADLFLSSTSVYDVEINSLGGSDQIVATGSAEVGGSIVVIPESLNLGAPVTYTIITTKTGVTGEFSSLTSPTDALIGLIYNPLTVQLVYLPFDSLVLTGNALKAANCFVGTTVSADQAAVDVALLALSFDDIQKAFEQMGPQQLSSIAQVQLVNAILIRSAYTKHMQETQCQEPPLSLWGNLIGEWQQEKKSNNLFGYNDTTLGATIGADYHTHNFVLGSAISYTHDNFHWKQSGGKGIINSYYGGFYGNWNSNPLYINGALLGALNYYGTARHLNFGTIDRFARSHHSGVEWLANFGVGYQVSSSNFQWTPYINLDYVYLHEGGYAEKGAKSLDLHVHTKNGTLFQGEGGVLLSAVYCAHRGKIIPTLSLAYINQTPFSAKNYYASFENSTCTFSGKGRNFERNLFAPSLTLAYQRFCGKVDASVYYDAEIGSKYWAQDVGFTLSTRF